MMTPEERAKRLDEYHAKDIQRVKAILESSSHQESWGTLAEKIVDELDPPIWRKR